MEVLYLAALKDEIQGLKNFKLTGVGKINASFVTTDMINKYHPKKIINFGTAGSTKKHISGLVKCSHFIQRDMDVTGLLDFKLGETPFDNINEITFGDDGLTCATGDSFVKSSVQLDYDIVDMEAYAIAKIDKLKNIKFECYKYISDYTNENSNHDWNKNINKGAQLFLKKFPDCKL